jgi:hypothetical protein
MLLRTLALLFCIALFAQPAAAGMGDRVDALHDALIRSGLSNLPSGVTAAHIAAAKVDPDDANLGVLSNVEVTFEGKDPTAKVNYLLFTTPALASNYLSRYHQLLASSGAPRKFLPYAPGADCADATKANTLVCRSAIGRVIVFSYGALQGETSVSGPLMKLAVDQLTAVRAATGTQ